MHLEIKRRGLLLVLLALASCRADRAPVHERTLFFRGEPAAQVDETSMHEATGKRVERRTRLPSGEVVLMAALLDGQGFVTQASYRRERRAVDLVGAVLTDGSGARVVLRAPLVALELLRHVNPKAPTAVTVIDLASGEAMGGRVQRSGASVSLLDVHGALLARCNVEGACTGPGAFFEGAAADAPSLDTAPVEVALVATGQLQGVRLIGIDDTHAALDLAGPGQTARAPGSVVFGPARQPASGPTTVDREPALFIESADPLVQAFAAKHGSGADALADALTVATAVFPLLDARAKDAPPSAKEMIARGGDCDGAAALVTAALRALGHSARPVVGYRLMGARFVPHAWAEVYTRTGWLLVDASVPRVGSSESDPHLKLFAGLGSALTMGRVLGRLRMEPQLE